MSAAVAAANGAWVPDRSVDDKAPKETLRRLVTSREPRERIPPSLLPAYDLGIEMHDESRRNTHFSIIVVIVFTLATSAFVAWFFERMGRTRALLCGRTLAQSVCENTASMLAVTLRDAPLAKDGAVKPKRDAVLEATLRGVEARGGFAQSGGVSLVLVLSTTDGSVYADSSAPVAAKNSVTGDRPGNAWTDRRDVEGNQLFTTFAARAASGGGFTTMRVRVDASAIEEEETSTFFVQPVPNSTLMVVALAPASKDIDKRSRKPHPN